MDALRLVDRLVEKYDLPLARVVPFLINRPPNDKAYYPLYAKCIELDLPISINTGIPGPSDARRAAAPALPRRGVPLLSRAEDRHGPWRRPLVGEAIRLLLKYPNLYMMTSAHAPKYLPAELIQFMNTRGQHKVLFASDHAVLPFERCLAEAAALPFREGVLEKHLRENPLAVFRWDSA